MCMNNAMHLIVRKVSSDDTGGHLAVVSQEYTGEEHVSSTNSQWRCQGFYARLKYHQPTDPLWQDIHIGIQAPARLYKQTIFIASLNISLIILKFHVMIFYHDNYILQFRMLQHLNFATMIYIRRLLITGYYANLPATLVLMSQLVREPKPY